MSLPEGVLTRNNQLMETEEPNHIAEMIAQNNLHQEDEAEEESTISVYGTTNVFLLLLKHIPFLNIVYITIMYISEDHDKSHILAEGIVVLFVDIIILLAFIRFFNMSYQDIANLFEMIH